MKTEETDCIETVPPSIATSNHLSVTDLRDLIIGGHLQVPTLDGTLRAYVNLDSAASTPIARPVKETVDRFLEWYAAVHRGSGFKSQVSSLAYEQARERVASFVGADLTERTLIFVRNATEAINRCAGRVKLDKGDVVLTTLMEHHSNILAWRKHCTHVENVAVDDFGAPILSDLQAHLKAHAGHVRLVAISGGSNVTGVIPDIHAIARMVHEAGAVLLVDAAQLAPHRPIDMGRLGEPSSIDFLAMSAHKMYAPLGCGALIGPRTAFETGIPDLVGGGTVLFVSEEEEMWGGPPENEEAGSPNVVGAVAMSAATRFISEYLGWEWVIRHERDLTSYALQKLNEIPGLTVYGPRDPTLQQDRLGVIAFNLEKVDHQLTAAILSHEYAIGTRTGGFCAHPYLMRLFGVSHDRVHEIRDQVSCGDRRGMPGAVRISFGFYNSRDDVDAAVAALWDIQNGKWRGDYRQNPKSGEYRPTESKTDPAGWFEI
jgi:cysteine desulfurase/selenocysteine lyase